MDSSASCSRSRKTISGERTYSSNLRDLLQIKEDDYRRPGLTLRAILSNDASPTQVQPNRTLLDIIINDSISGNTDSRNTWKLIKDKLSLRRSGSSIQIPATDDSTRNSNRMISRQRSLRSGDVPFQEDSFPQSPRSHELNSSSRSTSLRRAPSRSLTREDSRNRPRLVWDEETEETPDEEETQDGEGSGGGGGGGGDARERMSLMSLLAENDGSTYSVEEEEEEEESSGGIEYSNCCVCMVRHKGAAFIPCGHTFCRLCSRELWVQRGNCPLCNNYILEILDIF